MGMFCIKVIAISTVTLQDTICGRDPEHPSIFKLLFVYDFQTNLIPRSTLYSNRPDLYRHCSNVTELTYLDRDQHN